MKHDQFDYDIADQNAQEATPLQFPVIFWRHGDPKLKQLGEDHPDYTGGFFFSYDQAGGEDVEIDGWKPASFDGQNGKSVNGLAAKGAYLTIVRWRRRWFRKLRDGQREYFPWNRYEGDKNLRGQMQAIGFIRGYDSPICFSCKGSTMQSFENAQREHYSKVMSIANREAPQGKKLPSYSIWMAIRAGAFAKVGPANDQSTVTLPELVLPKTLDREFALSRYVGKEQLQRSQELFYEAEQWAHAWDSVSRDPGAHDDEDLDHVSNSAEEKRLSNDFQREPTKVVQHDDSIPF